MICNLNGNETVAVDILKPSSKSWFHDIPDFTSSPTPILKSKFKQKVLEYFLNQMEIHTRPRLPGYRLCS
jgi:hypothetical protein